MKRERSNGRWNVKPLVTVVVSIMFILLSGASQAVGSKEGSAEKTSAGAKLAGRQAESRGLATAERPTELAANKGVSYTPKYAWSKQTQVYHYYECAWVKKIRPENLQTGDTPPEGRRLHRLPEQRYKLTVELAFWATKRMTRLVWPGAQSASPA